jgi:putative hydroxymethylpyrimidine transport system substrate-binding protein
MLKRLLLAAALGLAAIPSAAAADKLSVLLDWFVNPDHAPLVIAKEKGFYKAAGLDVDLIAPADPAAPPRLVAAKQADIAITYQPDHILAVKEGLPLVRFGTLIETPLNTVIALQDGPIKTIADLKGKKIGYSVSGFEDVILGTLLTNAGLTLKDVELINVNFNLTSALMTGQVDAVVGGYRNFEATELELAGKKARVFYVEENGVPAYDELIYVTHRDRANDPILRRFLDATEQATMWMSNHPDEAYAVFKGTDPKLADELNRRAFYDTLPRFAHRPAAIDTVRVNRFAEFLKERGLLDKVPPVDSYVVMAK